MLYTHLVAGLPRTIWESLQGTPVNVIDALTLSLPDRKNIIRSQYVVSV